MFVGFYQDHTRVCGVIFRQYIYVCDCGVLLSLDTGLTFTSPRFVLRTKLLEN